MNSGIDYGFGQTNIDKKTGIRFGVINIYEVGRVWFEESEAVYPPPCCPECGYQYKTDIEPNRCPKCRNTEFDNYFIEPSAFTYRKDGYKCYQHFDDTDIFVEKSPFFTYAHFCSPCAPGAVYLTNYVEYGPMGYCLGHDWFKDGKAPYPVFSVKTGKEVKP